MKFEITSDDRAGLLLRAPEFAPVIAAVEIDDFELYGDLFMALADSIISQQLSGRVAQVISGRVSQLLGKVTPEALLNADVSALRGCGLSARKIEYLCGAAAASLSGAVDFPGLAERADSEIIGELTSLKGVGVWTVEMLLIFAFGRRDILSFRDLGIRRGIMKLNRLSELSESEFEFYRKRYSPYGTLASLYLWRVKDEHLGGE